MTSRSYGLRRFVAELRVMDDRLRRALEALAVCWLLGAGELRAHDFTVTQTLAVLRDDGTFQVEMTVDLDALLLGVGSGHDPAELAARVAALSPDELEVRTGRLRSLFERRIRVYFDGEPTRFVVTFPDREEGTLDPAWGEASLGIRARLTGRIPGDAERFSFRASRSFPLVDLRVVLPSSGVVERAPLPAGEESPGYDLDASRDQAAAAEESSAGSGDGVVEVFGRYLGLGFTHIVPLGLDHILFVLALFLLSAKLEPLLIQVTAFTLAHSVTLALSVLGVISLPSTVVEPLIALSIALVAAENLFTQRLHSWRIVVVFVFGLLHGLGFAGVLNELGLPAGALASALIAFNVGVELGQLAVIGVAFLLVALVRQKQWYHERVVIPASVALAAIGLFWFVQRLV
ncbi:MAG TPA: HupE/UreJ family protein [Thermoanaerobaculia bacterium]|nr:HupE/UreJ family protein [Thermoanaerobaculia bacterium]